MLKAVRQCWASLFNARAVAYRLRSGTSHRDMPMAVGVIELIHARASGVAFSAHPVTGKTDRIVIETSWGWGEAVDRGWSRRTTSRWARPTGASWTTR